MIRQDKLEEMLKLLHNKAHEKFSKLRLEEREQRLIGYRQALKDLATKFEINL